MLPLGPSWFLIALGIARMALTPVQLTLNRQLGRRRPIGRRDRYDWALFGALMVAVLVFSVAREAAGTDDLRFLVALPLLPYSVLQLRQCYRSHLAHLQGSPRPMITPSARAA